MSVAKGKRGSSHLDAQTKTDEMVAHTIKILSNPNVFDPSQHALIDKVMECAIGIGECVNDANSVRVEVDAQEDIEAVGARGHRRENAGHHGRGVRRVEGARGEGCELARHRGVRRMVLPD